MSKEAYTRALYRIAPHSSAYLLGNVARDGVNADGVLDGLDAEAEECSDEHKRH
jgi:hypothetical protein